MGKWAHLASLEELPRYSILVGYLADLAPRGRVLDIGCGEGLLFRRYQPQAFELYVGVDISEQALKRAAALADERTRFVCADAETYKPSERFDAVVFNESLYYFQNPLLAVERYAESLTDQGVLLVSTYAGSLRARLVLRTLKEKYRLMDETHLRHGNKQWLCSVFAARGR